MVSPGTDLWRTVPGLYSHLYDWSARHGNARSRAADDRASIDTIRLCACGVEELWCGSCQPGFHCSPGCGMWSHTLSLACVALPGYPGPDQHSNRGGREATLRSTLTSHDAFWYGGSRLSASRTIASPASAAWTGHVVESASANTERSELAHTVSQMPINGSSGLLDQSYSYFSGHALRWWFTGLLFAWLFWRHVKPGVVRWLWVLLTLTLCFLGAAIQFYVGSHFISDTIAGYFLGTALACFAIGLLILNDKKRNQEGQGNRI